MPLRFYLVLASFFFAGICPAQKGKELPVIDTTFTDYDELFSVLDAFIDSINKPRNFTLFSIGIGNDFFSYESKSGLTAETKKKLTYSPFVGYYDKSGFGIGIGASVVDDGSRINPFQFSLTGSYDFQRNKAFIAGLSVSHYFIKNKLPFYTSPLQNEAYGYFTYRRLWFKPSFGLSYGWGSRNSLEEREEQIQNIQLAQRGFTRINTKEKVIDFNVNTSIRHDFYFLNALTKNDFVRITPQLSFVSGTQQFGFNQTSSSYAISRRTGNNILYNTDNITLDNNLYFQPISLTAFIKTEYSKGIFFIQPQLMVDYYFPARANNISTSFIINAGILF